MWENEHKLFDELADKCGNRYLAVKYIAKLGRYLNYDVPGGLLGSQLLTWALTGQQPETKFDFNNYYKVNAELACLEETLEYVTNDAVKRSVRKSYALSVRHHHLIYHYDDSLDQYEQGRVRILLRMIWSENFFTSK